MVSFSCDACQDVKTKPKALAHFSSCRTCVTMTCLDCSTVFTARSIGPHTSCISEASKYGPKPKANSQAFCLDCDLALNGAVHALQHYESKKHKKALRAKKVAQAPKAKPIIDKGALVRKAMEGALRDSKRQKMKVRKLVALLGEQDQFREVEKANIEADIVRESKEAPFKCSKRSVALLPAAEGT